MNLFEWDKTKNNQNIEKHRVSFEEAELAFDDVNRIIVYDLDHSSKNEKRYYCIGKVKNNVCTVRFTYRGIMIRIIGAGFWRKERKIYEKINQKR